MYTYTLGGKNGKKITLNASNDRVVVRTKNARDLKDAVYSEDGKQALQNFDIEMEFPEADVTILKTKKGVKSETAFRDNARNVLKREPELRFAGRVLVDPISDKPVIYTENLFVKFYDGVKTETCEKILAEEGLKIKQKLDYAENSYFVSAPEDTGLLVFQIAESLLNRKEVELCHPELVRKKSLKVINAGQWHLRPATINNVQVNAHVKADFAHLISQGENITIAVIDDGVDIDHNEFKMPGKVVDSRDATLNSNDPRPKNSFEKHGTACAGVASASGVSASGVAPKAKLMPIRLSSALGAIEEGNAFKWAVDHGADIISCSWGPEDGDWSDPNDPTHFLQVPLPDSTRLAIEHAVNNGRGGKGCVIFFAAGNGNEDVRFDGYASYDKVTAVAACNDTNRRSVYSDFGDKVWCSFPSSDFGHIPFNHPRPLTKGIFTTDRRAASGYNPGGDYTDTFGGTSSACPGAAGTAALILSANPGLTWLQVRDVIKDSCEKIDLVNGQYDANGHSRFYGYGKVDAEKAVRIALGLKMQEVSVKIISALVNPFGEDAGSEKVSLQNITSIEVDLNGWSFEVKGKKQKLATVLSGGEAKTINIDGTVRLTNTGATINLLNSNDQLIHSVSYVKKQVKRGDAIEF